MDIQVSHHQNLVSLKQSFIDRVPGAGRRIRWGRGEGATENVRWGYGGDFDVIRVK